MRRLSREQVVYSMSREAEPVISVAPGEKLLIETEDCFSFQLRQPGDRLGASFNYARINPATGPVEIAGAEPGDVLAVHIEAITVAEQGVVAIYPGWGPLGD